MKVNTNHEYEISDDEAKNPTENQQAAFSLKQASSDRNFSEILN